MSTQSILRTLELQESAVKKPPDLIRAIRKLITDTQRSDFTTDARIQKSVAYLWAAANELEGPPGSSTDGLH